MSINIRRLIELIKDEPTRKAFETLSRDAVGEDDVRKVISQTTFGFQESEGNDGGKEVTLKPIQGENVQLPNRPPFEDARRPHNI
tara:strand:+ start:1190 stop:1444 length:255 start_codon:yes stop_codon:yes gene_type:complete